jgi:hypothetical protein
MMVDAQTDDKPGTEEMYESATNTSNLKENAERRGSTDVLRDMAMSADRLGAALLRLRSQWESSTKPERKLPHTFKALLAVHGERAKAEKAYQEERAICEASFESGLASLAYRLGDLDSVRDQLIPVVMKWGWGTPGDPITRSERAEKRELDDAMLKRMQADAAAAGDDAQKMAALATLNYWVLHVGKLRAEEDREDQARARQRIGPVIRYWLDQTCTRCDGTKWEVVPGTRRQSTKLCKQCSGSGFAELPHGQDGRRLANYMDQAAHRYSAKMKARRRPLAAIPPIDRLSKRAQRGLPGTRVIDPESD